MWDFNKEVTDFFEFPAWAVAPHLEEEDEEEDATIKELISIIEEKGYKITK